MEGAEPDSVKVLSGAKLIREKPVPSTWSHNETNTGPQTPAGDVPGASAWSRTVAPTTPECHDQRIATAKAQGSLPKSDSQTPLGMTETDVSTTFVDESWLFSVADVPTPIVDAWGKPPSVHTQVGHMTATPATTSTAAQDNCEGPPSGPSPPLALKMEKKGDRNSPSRAKLKPQRSPGANTRGASPTGSKNKSGDRSKRETPLKNGGTQQKSAWRAGQESPTVAISTGKWDAMELELSNMLEVDDLGARPCLGRLATPAGKWDRMELELSDLLEVDVGAPPCIELPPQSDGAVALNIVSSPPSRRPVAGKAPTRPARKGKAAKGDTMEFEAQPQWTPQAVRTTRI